MVEIEKERVHVRPAVTAENRKQAGPASPAAAAHPFQILSNAIHDALISLALTQLYSLDTIYIQIDLPQMHPHDPHLPIDCSEFPQQLHRLSLSRSLCEFYLKKPLFEAALSIRTRAATVRIQFNLYYHHIINLLI
jgi:hypothetical protein